MRHPLCLVLACLCAVGLAGAQQPEADGQTTPEMTAADAAADQRLMSLMPSAAVMQQQLQALRDEHVVAQFEAGLRALRYGYARGNRSYLRIAAARFRDVVRLAPSLALGYFNLGLAAFYLDDFRTAAPAFAAAIERDKSLRAAVPLLWWEDFVVLPERSRLAGVAAKEVTPWFWQILPDAGLHFANQRETGLIVWQPHTGQDQHVVDSHVALRFRVANGGGVSIGCRHPDGGAVILVIRANLASLSFFPTHDQCQVIAQAPLDLREGWHVADLVVRDTVAETAIDGLPLFAKTLPSAGPGISSFTLWGPGEVLVDWILVTRD